MSNLIKLSNQRQMPYLEAERALLMAATEAVDSTLD